MEWITTNLGRLRLIGFLEGLSFVLLVGLAMPLKYIWGMPELTRVLGMAHGILFIAYILLVFLAKEDCKWSFVTTFWALLASLLPFGTFVADYKIFRKAKV